MKRRSPRRLGWRLLALLVLTVLMAAAGFRVLESAEAWNGCGSHRIGVDFARTFTNDDGVVDDHSKDPADNGVDPGNGKPIGVCSANIASPDEVLATLETAYPGYTCRIWVKVKNVGCRDVRMKPLIPSVPPGVTVAHLPTGDTVLKKGKSRFETFDVRIEQVALENWVYQFLIKIPFKEISR